MATQLSCIIIHKCEDHLLECVRGVALLCVLTAIINNITAIGGTTKHHSYTFPSSGLFCVSSDEYLANLLKRTLLNIHPTVVPLKAVPLQVITPNIFPVYFLKNVKIIMQKRVLRNPESYYHQRSFLYDHPFIHDFAPVWRPSSWLSRSIVLWFSIVTVHTITATGGTTKHHSVLSLSQALFCVRMNS